MEVILAYAATITIRLVFFVEAGAEFYQQIPTGIPIQHMGPKLYLRITSILSVVEATCDRTKSSQFTVCLMLQSFPYL